jgi:hypothetical protein
MRQQRGGGESSTSTVCPIVNVSQVYTHWCDDLFSRSPNPWLTCDFATCPLVCPRPRPHRSAAYSNPVSVLRHAAKEGYGVYDFSAWPLPFGTYSSQPEVRRMPRQAALPLTPALELHVEDEPPPISGPPPRRACYGSSCLLGSKRPLLLARASCRQHTTQRACWRSPAHPRHALGPLH